MKNLNKWCAVNYETGETLETCEPCLLHEAIKMFKSVQPNLSGFFFLESIEDIQSIQHI